ncbi:uncharacterized protein METZ01_LOCUS266087 [marine metagenome]|uniref:Uncharacterized protein n=1 Tax=marine metagenome TaxID=408172 RepID=A0A382JPV1_9ZZZZ
MTAALILDREESVGFPGGNTTPVLGRPLMNYPPPNRLYFELFNKI